MKKSFFSSASALKLLHISNLICLPRFALKRSKIDDFSKLTAFCGNSFSFIVFLDTKGNPTLD